MPVLGFQANYKFIFVGIGVATLVIAFTLVVVHFACRKLPIGLTRRRRTSRKTSDAGHDPHRTGSDWAPTAQHRHPTSLAHSSCPGCLAHAFNQCHHQSAMLMQNSCHVGQQDLSQACCGGYAVARQPNAYIGLSTSQLPLAQTCTPTNGSQLTVNNGNYGQSSYSGDNAVDFTRLTNMSDPVRLANPIHHPGSSLHFVHSNNEDVFDINPPSRSSSGRGCDGGSGISEHNSEAYSTRLTAKPVKLYGLGSRPDRAVLVTEKQLSINRPMNCLTLAEWPAYQGHPTGTLDYRTSPRQPHGLEPFNKSSHDSLTVPLLEPPSDFRTPEVTLDGGARHGVSSFQVE